MGLAKPASSVSEATSASTGGDPRTHGADGGEPGASSMRAAQLAAEAAKGRRSIGACYAWVKRALLRAGAVPDYMPGLAAREAGGALARRGFVDVLHRHDRPIRSPYDAPVGAVLVYDPTPDASDKRYGHIELRTAGGFASDYASPTARTGPRANGLRGRQRELAGVWVKSD